jgi:hypothetical protein
MYKTSNQEITSVLYFYYIKFSMVINVVSSIVELY